MRQRRIVAISKNLAAWSQPFANRQGASPPSRKMRGIARWETIAQSAGVQLLPNVLRHSFGSYRFARHRNENLIAAEMANSPAMIFQHYGAVVTPEARREILVSCSLTRV